MKLGNPNRSTIAMTLIDTVIATGLGSVVLGAVVSLSIYSTRSTLAVSNYTDLDAKSRYALDVISRELRQATAVTSFQNSNTTLQSLTFTNAGAGTSDTLSWNSTNRTLVLSRSGQQNLAALTECDQWIFSFYQRTPLVTPTNILFYPATNASGNVDLSICKLVDMSWKCSRTIMGRKANTENVQASQIVLRNKQ